MASFARNVMTELLAVLRSDWGDYDLSTVSGTPKVEIGRAIGPPMSPPFLYLSIPKRISSQYGEASLGQYDQTAEIHFQGFVPSDSLAREERVLDGLDFVEELERKITVAHVTAANVTLYNLLSLLVEDVDVEGDVVDMPDTMIMVEGVIRYRRITSTGI